VAVLAPELDSSGPALAAAVDNGGTADCTGYGTFLAGVVAARAVEEGGAVGVAPEADLVFVPTGSPETGVATAEDIAAGISSAADAGADVILVGTGSWLGSGELEEAVESATGSGALVVAPANVDTSRGTLPGYPAQHPAVLSVAAGTAEGPPATATVLLLPSGEPARVDLLAPGDRAVAPGVGGGYVTGSGSGVAAAFTAGAAALLIARHPVMDPAELRERLLSTAYPSPRGDGDPVHGSGQLDPLGALVSEAAEESRSVQGEAFVPDPSPLGSLVALPTALVAGCSALLVLVCGLGAAVVRNGRPRGWRPAAPEETVPIGPRPDVTRVKG
jgi:membrane-anchored mycosin MYCP